MSQCPFLKTDLLILYLLNNIILFCSDIDLIDNNYFSILGEQIDEEEYRSYQDSFNAFDGNNNGRISHKSLQVGQKMFSF